MTNMQKTSNLKNPNAITSTKLRKHLATMSQIFAMTSNDLEQLSTFMGHTSDVHKQAYRLPDDVYQTAKISKLLLLMEKEEAIIEDSDSEPEEDFEENLQQHNQLFRHVAFNKRKRVSCALDTRTEKTLRNNILYLTSNPKCPQKKKM
ncbi:hypothetical protein JTB14_013618 [Gonioctena quinquepunctata]|nr:hypothetical protein JTB14_013618 [Gonioctena quinquepunctata]